MAQATASLPDDVVQHVLDSLPARALPAVSRTSSASPLARAARMRVLHIRACLCGDPFRIERPLEAVCVAGPCRPRRRRPCECASGGPIPPGGCLEGTCTDVSVPLRQPEHWTLLADGVRLGGLPSLVDLRLHTTVSPPPGGGGGIECGAGGPCGPAGAAKAADEGAAALAAALATGRSPALRRLALDNTGVGDAGIAALASAMATGAAGLGQLRRLELPFNQIGSRGCAALAGAFKAGNGGSLEFVHLSGNAIGDDGLGALGLAFREEGVLSNLRRLSLDDCGLTDAGVERLAENLRPRVAVSGPHARWTPLPTLYDLELSNDAVGRRGLWALSRAHIRGALPEIMDVTAGGGWLFAPYDVGAEPLEVAS